MKTTLNLNDALLVRAKTAASQEHTSLTRLIEEGLALRLRAAASVPSRRPVRLPVYPGTGGLAPTVTDPTSNCALLAAADGTDAP